MERSASFLPAPCTTNPREVALGVMRAARSSRREPLPRTRACVQNVPRVYGKVRKRLRPRLLRVARVQTPRGERKGSSVRAQSKSIKESKWRGKRASSVDAAAAPFITRYGFNVSREAATCNQQNRPRWTGFGVSAVALASSRFPSLSAQQTQAQPRSPREVAHEALQVSTGLRQIRRRAHRLARARPKVHT